MARKKVAKKKSASKKKVSASKKKTGNRKKSASKKVMPVTNYERDLTSAATDALSAISGEPVALPVTEALTEMTIYTCQKVLVDFQEKIKEGVSVELDMRQVSEMDTTGFQLLVALKNGLAQLEKKLTIVQPSEVVREILERYRANDVFSIA